MVTVNENWKDSEHLELLANAVDFLNSVGFISDESAKEYHDAIAKDC